MAYSVIMKVYYVEFAAVVKVYCMVYAAVVKVYCVVYAAVVKVYCVVNIYTTQYTVYCYYKRILCGICSC